MFVLFFVSENFSGAVHLFMSVMMKVMLNYEVEGGIRWRKKN